MNYGNRKLDEATTPEEMRAALYKIAYDEPVVNNVVRQADYTGLSAEDKYTILSYYALKQMMEFRNLCLDQSFLSKSNRILIKDDIETKTP